MLLDGYAAVGGVHLCFLGLYHLIDGWVVSQARPFSAQGLSLSVGTRAEGSGESGALFVNSVEF